MNATCNLVNRVSPNWSTLLRTGIIIFIAIYFCGCKKDADLAGDSSSDKELSKVEGVSIQYADGGGMTSWGIDFNGEYAAKKITFEGLLSDLWPQEKIEIAESTIFAGKYFNVTINGANEPKEIYWKKFKNAFEQSFNISIIKKTQLMELKVLTQIPGSLKVKKVEDRSSSSHGTTANGYKFESQSIDEVAEVLGKELGIKVINETGLEGKYDFEVKMDIFEPKTFSGGLKEIGLELLDEKREIDVIVIEKLVE